MLRVSQSCYASLPSLGMRHTRSLFCLPQSCARPSSISWRCGAFINAGGIRHIAASNHVNTIAGVGSFTALRGSADEGLLMLTIPVRASDGASTEKPLVLGRGTLVEHEGVTWACIFQVSNYWFATPLDKDAQAARWFGNHGEPGGEAGVTTYDAVVGCLTRATPTQAERAQLQEGILTGVAAVDVLAPIGRGQSMLLCGPRESGKSALACEIIEQVLTLDLFDKVVRFCTDPCAPLIDSSLQRPNVLAELWVTPCSKGGASPSAACLLGSFFDAIAVAEASRESDKHSLIVLDTLAPIISAWELAVHWAQQMEDGKPLDSDLLSSQRRVFFSNIFERAASLKNGGSLTMFAVVETDALAAIKMDAIASNDHGPEHQVEKPFTLDEFVGRKASDLERLQKLADRGVALTPKTLAAIGIRPPECVGSAESNLTLRHSVEMRELQSISDGQVVFDGAMAAAGAFPAVVPGATFSRFGLGSTENTQNVKLVKRDVRPAALQAVAAHLRGDLALEGDKQFLPPSEMAGEAAAADAAQSARMDAVRAALLQQRRTSLQAEEIVALLLAACSGAFDTLPPDKAKMLLRGGQQSPFLQYLYSSTPQVLKKLREEERISVATARELDVAVRLFVELQKTSANS
mmetsp:Transcript_46425/g.92122  ORF Transcript_46425/g.92122 Transcript_46425/m.92122 type:complete len:635 (-) Transcript_46425:109-2013(-)